MKTCFQFGWGGRACAPSSWRAHPRRDGAGAGDDGLGCWRTIAMSGFLRTEVRFQCGTAPKGRFARGDLGKRLPTFHSKA